MAASLCLILETQKLYRPAKPTIVPDRSKSAGLTITTLYLSVSLEVPSERYSCTASRHLQVVELPLYHQSQSTSLLPCSSPSMIPILLSSTSGVKESVSFRHTKFTPRMIESPSRNCLDSRAILLRLLQCSCRNVWWI